MITKYVFIPTGRIFGNKVFPHTFVVFVGDNKNDAFYSSRITNYPNSPWLFEPYSIDFVNLFINDFEYAPFIHYVRLCDLYNFLFGSVVCRFNYNYIRAAEHSLLCKRCQKRFNKQFKNTIKHEKTLFDFRFDSPFEPVDSCPF